VWECILTVLYDSFWPVLLWISPLLLLLSLSECLLLGGLGCNPLQRPTPLWPWETSCGLALPLDPPWHIQRKIKRKDRHYSFIQREQRRVGNVRSWYRLCQDATLEGLPWGEDTVSDPSKPCFDPLVADKVISRLNPLEYFHRLNTITSGSYIATKRDSRVRDQALVAATDLRATYKAADMSRFSKVASTPYVLHTVDDHHIPVIVDTGASISISPNASDLWAALDLHVPKNF
jgi:hypothetical protein